MYPSFEKEGINLNYPKLDRFSYRIFGKRVSSKAGEALGFQHKLVQARIGVPAEVYFSRSYLVSILSSVPAGVLVYILLLETLTPLLGSFSFLIIPFLVVLSGFAIYNIMLAYPGFAANLRGKKIDIAMPHAVALMHALSRGSSDIIGFFEIIGKNKKIYGEISGEVKDVLIETKILNLDLKTALKNSGKDTPSESYKSFLESLSTIITSGEDLVAFFLSKSEQYRQKALNENKAFMETLGLMSEVYVTGFAAGPLFIIVLLVVLGLIGGTKYDILLFIVYLFIPFGSLIFVIFFATMAEGVQSKFIKIEDTKETPGKYPLIKKGRLRMQIYQFINYPLKNLIEVPENVLFFSIPVGLVFFILSTYSYYSLEFDRLIYKIDDYIVFTAVIILVPYMLFVEAHFRRISQISRNFPEFLNRLVSLHESGLTIAASLKHLGSSNLGILNSEIYKINTDIELHGSIVDAFRNFGNRVNTVAVQRTVVLIENAIRMTGNIKDTLVIAANDALAARSMEEDRISTTKMHIVVLYISFFVFLYVIYSLVTGFFPQLPDVPQDSAAELLGEGITFSGIDKPLYVRLFFHASLIEGFFSGLVAGQIGEGDARLGLKHGIIMMVFAYALFMSIA